MTRFEEIGVQRQSECCTRFEAEKQFRNSCSLCCNRGFQIECDRCAIANEHRQVLEAIAIIEIKVVVVV